MTLKSLGLRTGSYGSLQLQQSNGVLQNHTSSVFPRRSSKVSLSSYREKERERCFPCSCRFVCRRKAGMAILVAFALLAFASGFFTANKETIGSNNINVVEALQQSKSRGRIAMASASTAKDSTKEIKYFYSHTKRKNNGHFLAYEHPCKNFALPPPLPPNSKRIGPRPCPVCYLSDEQAVANMPSFPSSSPVLQNLTFVHEENSTKTGIYGGSDFGGYPSLNQRTDAFDVKESMTVHCGFVKGSRPGRGSKFDVDEDDLLELDKYHDVIVASAIFGNYDVIQEPVNISKSAKRNVPFYMFIDEETEKYMKNKSVISSSKMVGIWRIIVVRNVPYNDARRNGKVPKLLLHRLFPNVRYSIWIDGKLKLVRDPYQVLERFLWRENATFAISRHYKRFDVFVEAEANKAGGKYDNASIDYQIDFYRNDGLTPYSEAKLPITSDVPEGCVIIREHIPITNLFTCLWFNEVDRFTSRDQLSFSTVRDKIMSKVSWSINMFLDCERRNFVVQAYHRELLEHMPPPRPLRPPRIIVHQQPSIRAVPTLHREVGRRLPSRRGRDRRSGSRRRRKVVASSRDTNIS
ncbi:probable hexosyltransferase MUCI70 [Amaranthus tricolor]|uniref:probable hexosyltransferase MUCI70 n=1 Tax=Amaranthus tricolor TaxID=29722 RepID=UPI002586E642|nr:probable hexosyltransferase MUCI70 [Amaranthus tricolor]XP_057540525.1 probable hexosyltransferase MUCI70 [Amaranthus tricolor]